MVLLVFPLKKKQFSKTINKHTLRACLVNYNFLKLLFVIKSKKNKKNIEGLVLFFSSCYEKYKSKKILNSKNKGKIQIPKIVFFVFSKTIHNNYF